MRQGSSMGSRTMIQRYGIARDLTVCGLFTVLTAVGTFIKIATPVEVGTMDFILQWFFVLLAGLLLSSKRAFLSVSTYLLIGLVRIPVLARGGRLSYLICPILGFLLGFTLVAYVMGKVVEWAYASRPGACLFSATVECVIYYGMGILYFYFITHSVVVALGTVRWNAILAVYCPPTVIPDHMLCIPAVTTAGRLRLSMGWLME